MTNTEKHPVSGILSVVMAFIALIMIIFSGHLGITKMEEGFATLSTSFVIYLFLCMTVDIIAIFAGVMGLQEENAKKIFPVTGLVLAGIFVVLLAFIVVSSAS
jgi:hypothetical protein